MVEGTSAHRYWFSLRSLLVAILVICVSITLWQTSRRLADSQSELRQLRDEVGYLSVKDRTKLHAVALDTGEANTWRWRMFIPKGHRYQWKIACKDIPLDSPPQSDQGTSTISNEPYWESDNEVLVTARLQQDKDESWTLSVSSKIGDSQNQMGGATLRIPQDQIDWMLTVPATDGQVIGTRGTDIRDPEGPIILLQRRPCEKLPDGSYRPSKGPMPGFMIWLSKWQ